MALPQLNSATYELTVPSTGEVVKYRPYLVKEEKVLMLALESDDEKQILSATTGIIEACTFGKVDAKKLPMFDVEYLFLKLRSVSVGETSALRFKCKECETYNDVYVDLSEINIDTSTEVDRKIQLTDEVGVMMKWPSLMEVEKNTTRGQSQVDAVFSLLAASIESIYDAQNVYPAADHSPQELKDFLESLNQQQFGQVQKYFESMPRLSHKIEFNCEGCGHHNEMVLSGLQSFFA